MSAPLSGRRVLVTRTRERSAGIVDALHALGADVMVVPLIAIEPLASPSQVVTSFDRLLRSPPPRWLVFTSAEAARLVLGVIGDDEGLLGVHIATVSDETALPLRRSGRAPDLVAQQGTAATLAEDIAKAGVHGGHVWFPAAEGAAEALPRRLRDAGGDVDVQPVYRTVMPADAPRRLRAALGHGVDAVTLTSGSTARHLVEALHGLELPSSLRIACIGESTAAVARSVGLGVDIVADHPSGPSLAHALARYWSSETVG
ncbi:MAG: uroporphyrinogen-III synthase [Candidatus Dormibacteria bacterium]